MTTSVEIGFALVYGFSDYAEAQADTERSNHGSGRVPTLPSIPALETLFQKGYCRHKETTSELRETFCVCELSTEIQDDVCWKNHLVEIVFPAYRTMVHYRLSTDAATVFMSCLGNCHHSFYRFGIENHVETLFKLSIELRHKSIVPDYPLRIRVGESHFVIRVLVRAIAWNA